MLRWPLRLTWAGLWAERFLRAFWPVASLVLILVSVMAFGAQDQMTAIQLRAVIGVALLALGTLAIFGLQRFRAPLRAEALARLDASLKGNPIAALTDEQAIGTDDPASRAVWEAHKSRMALRAAQARAVVPNLRLASRDPYALRYVALTAFVMAMIFGSLWRLVTGNPLATADAAIMATGPSWEGWAQPPAYTGKAAIYLGDITAPTLELPVGTRLQVRVYGDDTGTALRETVSDPAATNVPADAARTAAAKAGEDPAKVEAMPTSYDFLVSQSGKLEIDGEGARVWDIIALKDAAPTVTPEGAITREADGRLKQAFSAADDYGVASGQVTISLDLAAVDRRYGLAVEPEPRDPVVLDLPMPIRGDRADFKETLIDDLSQHPFANLPVKMVFSVTDEAMQVGTAMPLKVVLPGRRFFDPLAMAVIEMRRDLLWSRQNAPRAAQILKAVTNAPEGFIRNENAFLRLRVALRRLDAASAALTPELRDELAAELWAISLMFEEGDLASALERLRRAQDKLDEAIRNGASPDEVGRLMQDMREALNEYMRELAEEQKRNPNGQNAQNQPGFEMSQDQLQQMLDELQKLIEEGRTAEAAELMERLRQFMENMQVTQGQGQGQGGPGQQAMRDMQETLRDQQQLSDDAFRDMQKGNQGQQPGEGQQGQQPGQDQPPGGQQDGQGQGQGTLTDRQNELRNRLGDLQGRNLPGDGTTQGEAGRDQLGRAERAMREAERALRDGDLPGALDRQAEAMEALREGMRNFGEALAQQRRDEMGDSRQAQDMGRADPNGRDPLGREPGDSARIGSDRNMLQGDDVYRRAQDLLDEIRRRSGELARPEPERDYLRRLLDQF
ncbi:MAG: TIGR02302 family protein [Pseudomonadota bacterium]